MHEIKQSDLEELVKISEKMNSQDKRCTSYPLFVVYDREKEWNEDGDQRERKEDFDIDYLCDECKEELARGGTLEDWCTECDSDCFWSFNWVDRIQENHGIFFTAEACDEYIQRRRYEFNKPYSYAISAYWSEEMKLVMNVISGLTNDNPISLLK